LVVIVISLFIAKTMHHQDICSILRILDDYFLLLPDYRPSTIKCKKIQADRSNAIIISRELKNGFLDVEINGQNEDDDDVDIIYCKKKSQKEYDKKIQINCNNFTFERVRQSIRDLVIYDTEQCIDT
jgi:hypothetical protein